MANRISTEFSFSERGNGLKKIKADVKEADGLFGKMKAGIKGVGEELKTNRAAQAAVGTAAVAAAKVAIDAASDLGESVNAVKVVYKDASDEVLALGENSAESFGLSQRAFNEFAVQFSAFASQIADNSGRSVVEVVEEMTTRVADFASVHNLSMEEAARVVQSTMAGETEAFRRFGGDVSAATIKAKAYEDGIAEVGDELTEGQKVLARYSAFMEQTGDTAGDFANTSDSLANQQRILTANIEDAAAAFGEVLLPAAEDAAAGLVEIAEAAMFAKDTFEALPDPIERTSNKLLELGSGPVAFAKDAFGRLKGVYEDVTREQSKLQRAQTDFIRDQFEAATATEEATEAVEEHTDRVSELNQWVDKARYLQEQYTKKTDAKAASDEEAAQAAAEHKAKLDELIESIYRGIEGTFSYEKANIDLSQQVLSLAEQEAATNEVLQSSTATAAEKEAALYDLREAQIATAEQAWETAVAYAEEQGAAAGSEEAARLQKEELERLAAKFPELRGEIDQYIAKLNTIPTNIRTQVSVSGGAVGTFVPRGGSNVYGAEGAIVNRPTQALIGEAGPEAVIPLHKVPGNRSVDGLAQSMGGGGNTYEITVVGFANEDSIQQLTKALDEVERRKRGAL